VSIPFNKIQEGKEERRSKEKERRYSVYHLSFTPSLGEERRWGGERKERKEKERRWKKKVIYNNTFIVVETCKKEGKGGGKENLSLPSYLLSEEVIRGEKE